MKIRILLLALMCSPLMGYAQNVIAQDCPENNLADQLSQHVHGCPNDHGLVNICVTVGRLSPETAKDSPNTHLYQTKIHNAACVTLNDGLAIRRRKIQALWEKYGKNIKCSMPDFDIAGGSLLKYAVKAKADKFINDAARIWKVNLNTVDAVDKRTVLDYVQYQLQKLGCSRLNGVEKQRCLGLETKLTEYYETLKNNGAKHCSELTGAAKNGCPR